MDQQLSEEQVSIIRRVEKLLALANRKQGNEAEAAAAASKAQEMLAAYNIDLAMVEQGTGTSGRREEAKHSGGVYLYQRDLWRAVAELNFCLYWTGAHWERIDRPRAGTRYKLQYRHNVVGRTVNVRLTQTMASYLEQTIERLVMERLGNDNTQRFSRWAVSYRKGAAARIIEKVQDRRRDLEVAEAERIRRAQHEAERAGASTATALTLASVRQSERDANLDYIYGEGYSARKREDRRKASEEAARAEAEYTAWAAAHPEEARKEADKRRKQEEAYWNRRRSRAGGRSSDNIDRGAYWAGYDAAQAVGIDPQTSHATSGAKRLR